MALKNNCMYVSTTELVSLAMVTVFLAHFSFTKKPKSNSVEEELISYNKRKRVSNSGV